MTLWKPLAGAAVLAAAMSIGLVAQQPTFKTGTQVVSIFATVTDAQKRLVPGLSQDDFSVFDNEKPQALVLRQQHSSDQRRRLLDTSGSMTLTIDLLKQAAEQFLLRCCPTTRLASAFNDKIQFNAKWSNNRDQLITDAKNLTTATARDYGTRWGQASTS
jgi:hypothetical protein